MPEALNVVLALDGLALMLLAVTLAGLVYGFAGFGSAMIYIPIATAFVSPQMAVASFSFSIIGSAITVLPEAWRKADQPRTILLVIPAFLGSLLGIFVLKYFDPTLLRWGISLLVIATLAALVFGFKRRMKEGRAGLISVGAGTGFVGGATGLLGPVIILFNLSGDYGPEKMRANTLSFLTLFGVLLIPALWIQGIFTPQSLWLGVLLTPLYALGTVLGRLLFNPAYEGFYRWFGYGVVAIAVLVGLPVWG